MARLQCKPVQGTLLKKKTVVILSSTQSTLEGTPQSNIHTHIHQEQSSPGHSQMCFMIRSVSANGEKQTKLSKQKGGEKRKVFHAFPPTDQCQWET